MANPLIKLEWIRRFRTQRAAWGIPLIVALPALVVVVSYAVYTSISSSFAGGPGGFAVNDLSGVGVGMFAAVVVALTVALMAIVPAMVGGTISGERQNQTLQPLQLTQVGPTQIILGKLFSSLAYLLLLLVCCTPVLVIPFMMGGTTAFEILGTLVVLLLVTVEFAAVSLMASAITRRPATGILLSLLFVGMLMVVPWIVMTLVFSVQSLTTDFEPADSAARLIATVSPTALGAWVVGSSDDATSGVVDMTVKLFSVAWFLVITGGSLLVARARVVAPVERDR